MATGLALLEEAVEVFAVVDVEELSSDELHDTIRRLSVVTNRLEAQVVRVVHRWDATLAWADNGSKAPGARLARETRLPKGDAKRLVRRGRALQSMPLSTVAYQAGEINGAHVDLLASCDREWVNDNFAEFEAKLVGHCRDDVYAAAAEEVRMWQLYAERDIDNPDPDKAARDADKNTLSASTSFQGRVFIDGNLDALSGEIVKNELDRLCELIRLQDVREGVERTPTQRRAAALVEMATRSAAMPANAQRPRPLFTMTMGVGHFAWLCHTAAGTIIEPELLMPYLSQAEIERIVYDPPNRKIEASHRTMFTGVLRKIIGLRDRHCQHPSGCDEPIAKCDVDHIEPRSCGGITCLCNGQLLCTFHNRIVKAEHDRRLALQHNQQRDAERHQTGCLLATPEPAEHDTDTDDDDGAWRLCRVPDANDPRGWITLDEFRRRDAA
jgi:hypothetical protein